jgi:hypothetical protein
MRLELGRQGWEEKLQLPTRVGETQGAWGAQEFRRARGRKEGERKGHRHLTE